MIKVNLIGSGRKKASTGPKIALPANFTPILLVLIALGFVAGGYWWYRTLTGESTDLSKQIETLEKRKTDLDAVIKTEQIHEARKKTLENRVKVIEGLQRNQTSPVLALDQLAEAVQRTQYIWLSSLDQRDAVLNMSGTATSLNAIADFYSNLYATGYFKGVDVGTTQEAAGNFTFSIKCEFAPPRKPGARPW